MRDRWGRTLLARRGAVAAREEGRVARSLGEVDFLLGVRDDLRQGALRFRVVDDGPFLADETSGVPLLTDLPELLALAQRAERDSADLPDLVRLVRAGSSLGGRPAESSCSAGRRPAGDREVPQRRPGYLERDGVGEGGAGSVEQVSADATRELRDLWRRVVFSVMISNTDDHLRNHGFLHARGDVWRLAPAFDLNPDPAPGPRQLSTAIGLDDDTASLEVALSVAEFFRLDRAQALAVVEEVRSAVAEWQVVAACHGLSSS